jgi:hypothetical protein
MPTFTLIVPYYRNAAMLAEQINAWNQYPPEIAVVLVDDGSPEPALPIVESEARRSLDLRVYRIGVDIPWNREGARNLGSDRAATPWLVHLDIDHVLPAQAARALLAFEPDGRNFYRFPRWRCGRADETRKKDRIPNTEEFGRIHPHVDSYLITRWSYWQIGGYDEDFSGCLGGGSDFLRRAERALIASELPEEIGLHVYTRTRIKDASDWSLSRDTSEGKRRAQRKRAAGRNRPTSHLRFPWSRQL